MDTKLITGLHHITALAGSVQDNVDFYAGVLGLRMVKKTVNFDAPGVYHLYYGNEAGSPGTIITFFPYPDLVKGRIGKGQATATLFSVPSASLSYWLKRLSKFKITFDQPQQRFGDEVYIRLKDRAGLQLELVFSESDLRKGFSLGSVPAEHAIKGLFGAALSEEGYEKTAALLTNVLEHEIIKEQGNRFRYSADRAKSEFIDILCMPDSLSGHGGSGTIHHLAFATPTLETQREIRERLISRGYDVTPVMDRQYFHSIYFREPGGVLFEVATIPPGFATDETLDQLGSGLKLPAWIESSREQIEKTLRPVRFDPGKFKD